MGFCKPMSEEVPLINTKTISKEELDAQRENAAKVQAVLQSRYTDKPLACVITYGCQQNVADSEHIKGMLADMGYAFTDDRHKAQFILFNTCAVREHAEDRVFGNVGALKSYKAEHPDTVIALCGCMMQQQHIAERIKQSFPFVDLVFGTHVVHRLPELLLRTLTRKKRVFELPDMDGVIAEGVPVVRDDQRRAWLPIMYGCNNFCTYCIVPYVRGRERSRQACDVLAEAKQLIADGYKEITLLGQNVNSYGKDLTPRVTFSQLLRQMNDLPGDFRIRFMTSHPKDCTKELLDTMAECPKVAKHLHLPFQCGNDRVLKAMNRGYTAEQYLELVHYAKAKMDDPVSHKEKARWMAELLALQEQISAEQMQLHRGETFKCFVSGKGKLGDNYVAARTDGNLIIEFEGDDSLIGSFQNVKVIEPLTYVLRGELERN